MVRRFSSRRASLYGEFLKPRLAGAARYDRIAGYFQSRLLELASESLADIPRIRIVCNTEVSAEDVKTVRMATGARRKELEDGLLRLAWNAGHFPHLVEVHGIPAQTRLNVLHNLLMASGKDGRLFEIRLVPDSEFGFVHGKGGIIAGPGVAQGKTSFIGSANDSARAWTKNYELVWEDDTPESVAWVQEEFDALWDKGFPLSEFIVTKVSGFISALKYCQIPLATWLPSSSAREQVAGLDKRTVEYVHQSYSSPNRLYHLVQA
jgi:phosphatidylserine/phosphatidylglycerophosphate/cardiolipin synthase-like enzyme